MIITIKKHIAEALGKKTLEAFGIAEDRWTMRSDRDLDLSACSKIKIDLLQKTLDAHKTVHGVGILLQDLERWRAALADTGSGRPRTVRQFESMLRRFLLKTPGHRIYKRVPNGAWLAYYVNKTEFHPEYRRDNNYHPAYTEMELRWEEFDKITGEDENFYAADCHGTVREILAKRGYIPETDAFREQHLEEIDRYGDLVQKIGRQCWASGFGTDDVDGNPSGRDSSWYWHTVHDIPLTTDAGRTRVVIDQFYENPKEQRDRDRVNVDAWFWGHVVKMSTKQRADDEDDDENEDEEIEERDRDGNIEAASDIPIHPKLAVFHLGKHLRLRVHINDLVEYEYDRTIADKLILNAKLKSLVQLLLEHKADAFTDIVRGKSGGAVVLLAGKPGTGKTLTAEVYSENEQRALYSVQCSQLGTDPDDLEDELLKVFARARRWNAVLLLDEADVYVHERGSDLAQNAIVGVFLRVLVYQSSVLFLTTNRPDDVDDAIASRCIARLTYPIPSAHEQAKIWQVLAEGTGVNLHDTEIDKIVAANPELSGRDVKNLLKLSMLVNKERVDAETVEYVKQFKPTGSAK